MLWHSICCHPAVYDVILATLEHREHVLTMKKLLRYLVVGFVLIILIIQLIPVTRANPPVVSDIPAAPEVKAILQRACYNCHSNETVYPWYSRVAPVSWLVAGDVTSGRKELNFSTWEQYSAKAQGKHLHEIWEAVNKGEMPPWYYTIVHRQARLSSGDLQALRTWTRASPQPKAYRQEAGEHQQR